MFMKKFVNNCSVGANTAKEMAFFQCCLVLAFFQQLVGSTSGDVATDTNSLLEMMKDLQVRLRMSSTWPLT